MLLEKPPQLPICVLAREVGKGEPSLPEPRVLLRRLAAIAGLPALASRVTSDVVGAEGGGARAVRLFVTALLLLPPVALARALWCVAEPPATLPLLFAFPCVLIIIAGVGTVMACGVGTAVATAPGMEAAGCTVVVPPLTRLRPLSRLGRRLWLLCTGLEWPRTGRMTPPPPPPAAAAVEAVATVLAVLRCIARGVTRRPARLSGGCCCCRCGVGGGTSHAGAGEWHAFGSLPSLTRRVSVEVVIVVVVASRACSCGG